MRSKFGSEIIAYALYQNIELRLPQGAVDRGIKKLFGVPVALGTTKRFKEKAAETYQITYNTLIKRAYQWSAPSRRRNKDQPQDW